MPASNIHDEPFSLLSSTAAPDKAAVQQRLFDVLRDQDFVPSSAWSEVIRLTDEKPSVPPQKTAFEEYFRARRRKCRGAIAALERSFAALSLEERRRQMDRLSLDVAQEPELRWRLGKCQQALWLTSSTTGSDDGEIEQLKQTLTSIAAASCLEKPGIRRQFLESILPAARERWRSAAMTLATQEPAWLQVEPGLLQMLTTPSRKRWAFLRGVRAGKRVAQDDSSVLQTSLFVLGGSLAAACVFAFLLSITSDRSSSNSRPTETSQRLENVPQPVIDGLRRVFESEPAKEPGAHNAGGESSTIGEPPDFGEFMTRDTRRTIRRIADEEHSALEERLQIARAYLASCILVYDDKPPDHLHLPLVRRFIATGHLPPELKALAAESDASDQPKSPSR